MELMVIEVRGLPLHEHMADKLKIHFQKRKNSGEDVSTVIYPTSVPGQAYVIFDSDKVPGVLEHTHILDIDDAFYPVHVLEALLSEVDMPIETTLDLSMFPDPQPILNLFKYYGFNIETLSGRLIQLNGSFLKLKLIRYQLMQHLSHKRQLRSRSPSDLHNGQLDYDLEEGKSLDSRLDYKSSLRNMDAVSQHQLLDSPPSLSSSYRDWGSAESPSLWKSSSNTQRNVSSPVAALVQKHHSHYISELLSPRLLSPPSLYIDSTSGESPRSSSYSSTECTDLTLDTMQQHTFRDVASGGYHGGYRSFEDDIQACSSHSIPSSSSEGEASFPVDTDTITFILIQRQDDVQMIEKRYKTQLVVQGNPQVTTVKFYGKNREKAKEQLQKLVTEISPLLCTHEIHLNQYDRATQLQISERVRRSNGSGVAILQRDDVIKLVGSLSDSFQLKKKILGHSDDLARGRAMERSAKPRRSASLPKQYKPAQHACSTDRENEAGADKFSPSCYQRVLNEGNAPQIDQGTEQIPGKSQRTRSNSETRDKIRTTKEQSVHKDVVLASSSEGKNLIKKNEFLRRFESNTKHFNNSMSNVKKLMRPKK